MGRLLGNLLQRHAPAGPEALPCSLDAPQESWIALQPILEPVVLRLEPDQDSGRLTMAGDDDLLAFRQS